MADERRDDGSIPGGVLDLAPPILRPICLAVVLIPRKVADPFGLMTWRLNTHNIHII